ncbi:pirin family protein [Flavobacteriaceae bacterium]|nr:pirin family protein [Flavobacteriaceae bacterium]MDB9828553.1 pirin family protein [Flavobacteriaceae bacterium]
MNKVLHIAQERGLVSFGWLDAKYSFSFGNYYNPDKMNFGALRVLNDDTIAPAMGFGKHPHKNMEIITIVQSGALKHEDSMGNKGIIEAGDIQVMSAGSGIEHSEVNASSQNSLTLFQLWIHSQRQDVTPRYKQKKIAPLLTDNAFTTIVKPKQEALDDDIWIHQQAYISIGNFSNETQTNYSMQQSQNGVYIMVIEGSIVVADQTLQHRDAIGLWNTQNVDISITKNSKVLIVEVPMI